MNSIKIGNVGIGGHLATLTEGEFVTRVGKQLKAAPIFKGRTEPQRIEWLKAAYKTLRDANPGVEAKQPEKKAETPSVTEKGNK